MDMSFNEAGDLAVTMSGESDGYRSIALQSQALAQNATLNDTIFSNFTVTPKGRVSFDVAFVIPKADLVFTKNLDKNPAPINQVSNEQVLDSQSDAVAEATDIVTETSSVVEQSDSPSVR